MNTEKSFGEILRETKNVTPYFISSDFSRQNKLGFSSKKRESTGSSICGLRLFFEDNLSYQRQTQEDLCFLILALENLRKIKGYENLVISSDFVVATQNDNAGKRVRFSLIQKEDTYDEQEAIRISQQNLVRSIEKSHFRVTSLEHEFSPEKGWLGFQKWALSAQVSPKRHFPKIRRPSFWTMMTLLSLFSLLSYCSSIPSLLNTPWKDLDLSPWENLEQTMKDLGLTSDNSPTSDSNSKLPDSSPSFSNLPDADPNALKNLADKLPSSEPSNSANNSSQKEKDFLGISIEVDSFIILLDVSTSMKPVLGQIRKETQRLLEKRAGKKTYVNIMTYTDKPTSALRGLKILNDKTTKRLNDFLRKIRIGGETSLRSCLIRAGTEIGKHRRKTQVIILTDGKDISIPKMLENPKQVVDMFRRTPYIFRVITPRLILNPKAKPRANGEYEKALEHLAEAVGGRLGALEE